MIKNKKFKRKRNNLKELIYQMIIKMMKCKDFKKNFNKEVQI